MRILLLSGVLLATASCAGPPPPDAVTAPAPPQPIALAVPAPPPPIAVVAPAPPPVAVVAPAPAPLVSTPLAGLFPPFLSAAPPPSGHLTLTNYNFADARVETVITGAADCAVGPGAVTSDFVLPLNGTRVIEAAPGADVCWRRAITRDTTPGAPASAPAWTEWNRAFVSSGRSIDSQL